LYAFNVYDKFNVACLICCLNSYYDLILDSEPWEKCTVITFDNNDLNFSNRILFTDDNNLKVNFYWKYKDNKFRIHLIKYIYLKANFVWF